MAQIEIISETEGEGGWRFDAQALDATGGLHTFTLNLGWADYNLWSADGADPPSKVAEAVLRFLLSRNDPRELRSTFDASIARRLHDDADAEIPRLIS